MAMLFFYSGLADILQWPMTTQMWCCWTVPFFVLLSIGTGKQAKL